MRFYHSLLHFIESLSDILQSRFKLPSRHKSSTRYLLYNAFEIDKARMCITLPSIRKLLLFPIRLRKLPLHVFASERISKLAIHPPIPPTITKIHPKFIPCNRKIVIPIGTLLHYFSFTCRLLLNQHHISYSMMVSNSQWILSADVYSMAINFNPQPQLG